MNISPTEAEESLAEIQKIMNRRTIPLVSEVVNQLNVNVIPFHELPTEQPNLEDVFLSLTGRAMRE